MMKLRLRVPKRRLAESTLSAVTLLSADTSAPRALPSARLPDSYAVPEYIYTAPVGRLIAERELLHRALFNIGTTLPLDRDAMASALRCLEVLDTELAAREEC